MLLLMRLLAQAPTDSAVDLLKLALGGGSLALALALVWYFLAREDKQEMSFITRLDKQEAAFTVRLDKQSAECKKDREDAHDAFLAALNRKDEFVERLQRETMQALKDTNRTLARANYIQDAVLERMNLPKIVDPPSDPSQSTIVRENRDYERNTGKNLG